MNSKSDTENILENSLMGFLIIEDFGDTTLLKKISENKDPTTLLILAIDILLKIETNIKKEKYLQPKS